MSSLTLSIPTSQVHLHPEPLVAHAPRQLLTPLPTPGHFLLVIDNSSLEVFTTCPKAADYKLVRRREAHERNAALTFGGAIHEGLELFLKNQYYANSGTFDMTNEFHGPQAQEQAIVKFFTENPAPLDDYRTVTNALAVLTAYRERAALPDYRWEILSDSDGPIIERAFELPLGVVEVEAYIDMPWLSDEDYMNQELGGYVEGRLAPLHEMYNGWNTKDALIAERHAGRSLGVRTKSIHLAWSGRIDAVARANGRLRVVDHKTTSQGDDKFIKDFEISNQVLGYVWAARQLWPEFDLRSFCANVIYLKRPAQSHRGPLTASGPKGGKGPLDFFRVYTPTNEVYTDERIEEWAENCRNIVSDFIHNLVRNYYPRHTKWCAGKYGMCPYHDVCVQQSKAVRDAMIAGDMFRPVTWNPVAGR